MQFAKSLKEENTVLRIGAIGVHFLCSHKKRTKESDQRGCFEQMRHPLESPAASPELLLKIVSFLRDYLDI